MLDNYIRGFAISKQKAVKLAAGLGVEITDHGTCLDLVAPKGKIFDDTHIRSYDLIDGRAGIWEDVIYDLADLSDCKVADCEVCQS